MNSAAVVGAVLLSLSGTLLAQDFQVGSRAKGMGGSYTAFEDDPVSIWLNPAGIARQNSLTACIHYQTFTQFEVERDQGFTGTTGRPEAGMTDPPIIPSFAGVITPFGSAGNHSLAFALVRPFENRLVYDFPAAPAQSAQVDQQFWRFRLAYGFDAKLGEEAVWFPHVSFGMAFDIAYSRFSFKSFSALGIVIDDIADTNTIPGGGAGILLGVYDDRDSFRLDIGAAYQSRVDFSFQQNEAVFASWDWPDMLNAGFTIYLFGQVLKLTADVQWIGWGLATQDSTMPGVPSLESSLNFSVGVEYEIYLGGNIWIMPRAGFRSYDAPWSDPSNLPAISQTRLNIATKKGRFSIFTAGFGFRWQVPGGNFRGVDVGVELLGDVTNYSVGYTHLF
jgi:hypothetical protein